MAQNISVDIVWRHWQRLRATSPLVHCMTNDVVTNWTANVLLAAGAAPAMVVDDSEAEAFAAMASALLINVGTLRVPQAQAMTKAVAAARQAGKPWVVDPVAVGVLPYRTAFCHILLEETPTVVRGNPSEILALAGDVAQGRGVDSTKGSDAALAAAQRLALEWDTVVAVTGATDYITDGVQTLRVVQGHPLLQRVTGTGCALSALVAACIAGTTGKAETLAATATACAVFAVAGEVAAQKTLDRNEGPGSFAVHLLDALDAVDEALLRKRMTS